MIRHFLAVAVLAIGGTLSHGQPSLPSSFQAKTIHSPEGADIFVRWGGKGPVVVLLHGYAENSDSWAPLAADLMKDHTVVVPDLRGIGRSSKPADGYDKKTQAKDIRAVVTALGYDRTLVVAHDIGNMVAYAYAAMYADKVERLVVMDAPIPGIEPWAEILQTPGVWHFNFHGPDAERLVAGRERIYFDRIWNDFTGDPSKPDEATRNFFAATYAQPGGMRAGFAQFTAFSADAADNKIFEQVKLTMPVLAVGGEKSFGPLQAVIMRHVATDVREAVVPGSGHWLMEERPAYTVALIRNFLDFPEAAGFMQGGMHHAMAKGVKLEQRMEAATRTITLRVGPMTLPAHTSHMKMPQPPDVLWTIPVDAWLLGYAPKLVDASGNEAPGRVLHHVAFWNENRADFLCPNKEEHIFGAGGEMTVWAEIPGYGYRVQKDDKIRIETMVHNPTGTGYDGVYLEVQIPYQETNAAAGGAPAVKSVYPAWMDVESCGNSGYDLKPGKNVTIGTVPVKYDGILLGVGGHMHDYAKEIVLEDATRKETVATLDAKVDNHGQLLSMPVVTFFDKGGYKFAAGDQLRITATYDNPTGRLLRDGAMGIVVGYFVPADDAMMTALRRTPKPQPHQMAGMTHDR